MVVKRLVFILMILMMALVACGGEENKTAGEASEELLPDLNGYVTVRETDLTAAFRAANIVMPTGLATGAMGILLNEFSSCAERRGIFASQVYINTARPDVVGVVAVINTTRLSSFDVLRDCMLPDNPFVDDSGIVIEPCADGWQYNDGEANYWIAYAASSPTLCDAFADDLPRN